MNIWLDDQRKAPEGWIHLHNFDEVERLIQSVCGLKGFYIDTMSFDFHLSHPKRGIDVMKFLSDQCNQNKTNKFWPKVVLYHSNDPEGVKIMRAFAVNFQKEILPKYGE